MLHWLEFDGCWDLVVWGIQGHHFAALWDITTPGRLYFDGGGQCT